MLLEFSLSCGVVTVAKNMKTFGNRFRCDLKKNKRFEGHLEFPQSPVRYLGKSTR